MNIERRLADIEKRLADHGTCQHSWQVEHRHEGEEPVNVITLCDECNLPKNRIIVEHVKHWKRDEPESQDEFD